MSVAILSAVRPFRTSPSSKAVLMALADYADDGGRSWPSLAKISEFTCLCERAVRNAIRDLEKVGVLACERASGLTTHYVINAEIARTTPALDAGLKREEPRHVVPEYPGTSCTPARDAPRHEMPETPAPDAANPGTECRRPRHVVPPNHQDPPEIHQRSTKERVTAPVVLSVAELVVDGLDEALAVDFINHRKRKKADLTARAWKGIKAEAAKAGWTLSAALEKTITRNWVSFEADWVATEKAVSKPSAVRIGQQDYASGWGK